MKIAVLSETSAADRNKDIIAALQNRGHEIFNLGMEKSGNTPELQYVHTGFLAGLFLNLAKVDLVIGGCGTGQGFLNAAVQYPNVFCGHILTPLDGWLFAQINNGNCISLALNQGYGWASDVNLRFIFDRYFEVEAGGGYPPHRKEPQNISRYLLQKVSQISHRPFHKILAQLPDEIIQPAISFPGIYEFLNVPEISDEIMKAVLIEKYRQIRS